MKTNILVISGHLNCTTTLFLSSVILKGDKAQSTNLFKGGHDIFYQAPELRVPTAIIGDFNDIFSIG